MPKLNSRSREVAERIRDRQTFQTYGALRGEEVQGLGNWDSGRLAGTDLEKFYREMSEITYVVWSYVTPIAWFTNDRGWHRVSQRFSVTTSHHQGKLYLIDYEEVA